MAQPQQLPSTAKVIRLPSAIACRTRLMRELRDWEFDPLPGIKVLADDKDISKMCLILSPPEGPFHPLSLHLNVEIPPAYPTTAPTVKIDTRVHHPNVYGDWVCCDILQAHSKMGYADDIRNERYNGGYTPAYQLKTIFLQLLSFFSTYEVEQTGGYVSGCSVSFETERNIVKRFKCDKCRYNVDWDATKPLDVVDKSPRLCPSQSKGPHRVTLDSLNDDCLLNVIENLPDQDLIQLCKAVPRVAALVSSLNILTRRHLLCFYLRKGFSEAILGIGIFQEALSRSSPFRTTEFDLLSYEAFHELGVRECINATKFTHFLPVALSQSHFEKALPLIKRSIMAFGGKGAPSAAFDPMVVLNVLPSLMNKMIVDLMTVVDEAETSAAPRKMNVARASEKALMGYYTILHLLLMLAEKYPVLRETATARLKRFIQDPAARLKTATPDLGQFLLLLFISGKVRWGTLSLPFVKQQLTRSVVWALDGRNSNRPFLAYLEQDEVSQFRLDESFAAMRVGLRTVMFQVTFYKLVTTRDSIASMTKRYGQVPPGAAEALLKKAREIGEIKTWDRFLDVVGINYNSAWKASTCRILKESIQESHRCGYSGSPYSEKELYFMRKNVNPSIQPPKEWDPNGKEEQRLEEFGVPEALSFFVGKKAEDSNRALRKRFEAHVARYGEAVTRVESSGLRASRRR